MKKIITLVLISLNFNCFAQDEDVPGGYDPTNWFTGGSVSISLGGYDRVFLAGLNPHFGYTIARWIDAAVVANFQYSSAKDEFNNKYLEQIEEAGMKATGINPDSGLVEVVELKDHPWFVGVQYHPELRSTVLNPHPLFVKFVAAAMDHKKSVANA